ncbi:MAG: GntR family transcriptional regulator [Candidatus Dactylopiibacterium carminicum]|uniref:GntR family transcriptional regulator n=1 Tax=Candidatus Dactylopiibacterium carminicum TaxID=857335 RepID=A0A272EUN0_9RHOO|nr:GntR family transcriptional regulator [Candidatus Dactylopiibacterium carminicum]KAF7600368.1 GntR family transcriptional regulator [Candidatus Dactylopiibacterium carminicum]PAS93803.1 MAG: GntR family transcriptional regulator [Candidatus Dactylopiibacterium carminicum]PAT00368.1 MAG: GntR family transcriptional regulator [Candidatus Dactylopiibacterium carminicum]
MAHNSPTFSPLYRQIKDLIVRALDAGEWLPGQAIPSEQVLAARFGVSQGTVRKAVDELAAENILIRRQGKGTFVSSHQDPRAVFRFLRLKAISGGPVLPKSQPLECMRAKAGQEAARNLGVGPGSPIVIVRRVLRLDGKPVVIDEMYLAAEVFPGLSLEMLRDWHGSLYSLFESRFGVRMVRATEKLRAVAAEKTVAEMLDVREGTPLLSVERVAYTYGDKPVEWRRGLYSTAEHYYVNELS